jgi:hypothetical protein
MAAKHRRYPNHLRFLRRIRPHADLSAHVRAAGNFYIECDPTDQAITRDTALLPRLLRPVHGDRELLFLEVRGRLGSKLKDIGSFQQGSDKKIAARIRGDLFGYSAARPFWDFHYTLTSEANRFAARSSPTTRLSRAPLIFCLRCGQSHPARMQPTQRILGRSPSLTCRTRKTRPPHARESRARTDNGTIRGARPTRLRLTAPTIISWQILTAQPGEQVQIRCVKESSPGR